MQVVGTVCGQDSPSTIEVADGKIVSITPAAAAGAGALGGPDAMVCPALLDVQVNGFAGHDLNAAEPTPDEVAAVTRALHEAGVGLYCPTVGTGAPERMLASLRAIDAACRDEAIAASAVAVHVEGPYISPDEGPRGAHALEHVREPDWDEFLEMQEAAGGRIGILTLAPERPGALAFIERLAAEGIIAAIGHTAATADQVRDAVQAGARLGTHVGNGTHAMLPRHPNYLWEQLAQDHLWATIIADGHHLPPSVVKCMVRSKGIERTVLISDAVRYAGLEPGDYEWSGRNVELTPDGAVRLKGTPFLAGAATDLATCVGNTVRFAGVSLGEAVRMATLNPARLLGVDDRLGTIEVGREASLTVFRWDAEACRMEVQAVLVRGEVVWQPH